MFLSTFSSINLKTACTLFTIFLLILRPLSSKAEDSLSLFIFSEQAQADQINGVGITARLKRWENNLGAEIFSSLADANIIDDKGINRQYIAWELGAKVGYFSDFILYAELGFDFGEAAFQSRREEDEYGSENNEYDGIDIIDILNRVDDKSNDIDSFIGVAIGYNFGHFELELFSKYRNIDGEYWKADNQYFTGLRASITF